MSPTATIRCACDGSSGTAVVLGTMDDAADADLFDDEWVDSFVFGPELEHATAMQSSKPSPARARKRGTVSDDRPGRSCPVRGVDELSRKAGSTLAENRRRKPSRSN